MPPLLYLLAAFAVGLVFMGSAMRPTPLPVPASAHPVIEARYNWRLALVALATGSLLLCFYWFGPDPRFGSGGVFHRVHGIGASLVMISLGAIGLLDRRVKLRVDDVGIRYSPWGDTTLYWSELVSARIVKGHAGLEQIRLRRRRGLGARTPSFGLSALFLDYGVSQLHAVIKEYLYKNR